MNEQRKATNKHLILQVIAALLMIAVGLQVIILTRHQDESASKKNSYPQENGDEFVPGKIIYLRENRVDPKSSRTELVLIDGEGNREQRLGPFTSSPAWSHDGNYIAVGCANPSIMCILDAHTISQARVYPTGNVRLSPNTVAQLEVPQPCAENGAHIVSVSWSPTNRELALVCSSTDFKNQEVCILSLESESSCWDHSKSDGVRHIDWSPVNKDQLVISTGSEQTPEIYLTDRNGGNRVFLDNGWRPAWSSDGGRIAFFRWKDGVERADETKWLGGIASIHPDGTDLSWLYRPWTTSNTPEENIYYSSNTECKLDWSPDNRYIVFSGHYLGDNIIYIFRLNIESGEIILLSNPVNRYRNNTAPDWGP